MGATELPAPSLRSQSMSTLPRSQEGAVNTPETCRLPERSPPQAIFHSSPPPSIKRGVGVGHRFQQGPKDSIVSGQTLSGNIFLHQTLFESICFLPLRYLTKQTC